MTFKTIFKGSLEFGNENSYRKVLRMYQHRVENFYKTDILIKEEDVFDESSFSLYIPRLITMATEKAWKNAHNLLEYLAQFAISGKVLAWMIQDGKIIRHSIIEPKNDKVAVQEFIRGQNFIIQGKEKEALEALNKAIHKYEKHALAYDRRGHINQKLQNYGDAMYDFTKSINLNPANPDPYIGRATLYIQKSDFDNAIADLNQAISKSIPLEPIYWLARRMKAECHIKLKQFEDASKDLKLFTNRTFTPENPNYSWRRSATFNYGKVLIQTGNFEEAIEAFDKVLLIENGVAGGVKEAEILFYKGLARQKAGISGYLKDWAEARDMGYEEAGKLLEQNT